MSIDQTRKAIEKNIADCRQFLELHQALVKLESNREFKRVIKDGFFRDEAIRLVHLKADPAFQTEQRQADIVKQIDAIGSLSSFFRTIEFNADQARKAISAGEAELDALAEEETAE